MSILGIFVVYVRVDVRFIVEVLGYDVICVIKVVIGLLLVGLEWIFGIYVERFVFEYL